MSGTRTILKPQARCVRKDASFFLLTQEQSRNGPRFFSSSSAARSSRDAHPRFLRSGRVSSASM